LADCRASSSVGNRKTQKGGRITGWIGQGPKRETAECRKPFFEDGFMATLQIQDMVQSGELGHTDRRMQLAESVVGADVRVLVRPSIGPEMIVAMIGEGLRQAVGLLVVGEKCSAFATRK
jgi:hypothetical protein